MYNNNTLPELKIFISHPIFPTEGDWIDLPMDDYELRQLISKITKNNEYIIADVDTNLPIQNKIKEHSNIYSLNNLFTELENIFYFEIDNNLKLLITALNAVTDIEECIAMLLNKEYEFFPNVKNEEELGLQLVEKKIVEVPEELEKFIDYEKIGVFWTSNGTFIDEEQECAIQTLY